MNPMKKEMDIRRNIYNKKGKNKEMFKSFNKILFDKNIKKRL